PRAGTAESTVVARFVVGWIVLQRSGERDDRVLISPGVIEHQPALIRFNSIRRVLCDERVQRCYRMRAVRRRTDRSLQVADRRFPLADLEFELPGLERQLCPIVGERRYVEEAMRRREEIGRAHV